MQYALYVVSRDGRPIFHYISDQEDTRAGEITDVTLFSGIISAIQGVMKEIDAGELSNFNTEKNKIFIKNQKSIAFVVLFPLSSDYTQTQVDQLFEKLTENLPFDTTSPDFARTREEDNMLSTIVSMLFDQWIKDLGESQAAKKLREDLW